MIFATSAYFCTVETRPEAENQVIFSSSAYPIILCAFKCRTIT